MLFANSTIFAFELKELIVNKETGHCKVGNGLMRAIITRVYCPVHSKKWRMHELLPLN